MSRLWRVRWARGSTTYWWMNIRTPISCRRGILLAMKPDGRGVTVVGDDAQSINIRSRRDVATFWSFQGVHAGSWLVTLEQNYRSTAPILDASNAVIDLSIGVSPKIAHDAQAGGVKRRNW